MTNTTVPHTTTGVVCGRCSSGYGKAKVEKRHADVVAVRACYAQGYAPKVEIPIAPAALAAVFMVPEATPFNRFSAKCPKSGCTNSRVQSTPFVLRCYGHGRRPVRTASKQLFGKVSASETHKCDPRCTGAVGNICVCQCGGANHGLDHLVRIS